MNSRLNMAGNRRRNPAPSPALPPSPRLRRTSRAPSLPLGEREGMRGNGSWNARRADAGFTMVEIALCLAIIAFALVAIIGVLPTGMRVQKENREDTIINQDGMFLVEAIRS